jgi:hypothetical protein
MASGTTLNTLGHTDTCREALLRYLEFRGLDDVRAKLVSNLNESLERVRETYGEVDTTWVVYGRRRRYKGELIGHRIPWLFTEEPVPA